MNVVVLFFRKTWKPTLAISAICILITAWGFRIVQFDRVARSKHLTADLLDLKRLNYILGPSDVLYVSNDIGPHAFMVSRWVAYILRKIPLVYDPVLHQGGYIYNLAIDFEKRNSQVTHILRSRTNGEDLKDTVFRNASYEVLPIEKVLLFSGFYGFEGWGRWMGQIGKISFRSKCANKIIFDVIRRFGNDNGEDAIKVESNMGSPKLFYFRDGKGKIEYFLPKGSNLVILNSLVNAKSPASVGLSTDSRELTFAFGKIVLETCSGRIKSN